MGKELLSSQADLWSLYNLEFLFRLGVTWPTAATDKNALDHQSPRDIDVHLEDGARVRNPQPEPLAVRSAMSNLGKGLASRGSSSLRRSEEV